MELSNGVLIHHPTARRDTCDLVVTLTRAELLVLLAGQGVDGVGFDGDTGVLETVLSLLDEADPSFTVVTP